MMYSPTAFPPISENSMECNYAADICDKLDTTVQHIWGILDEKDTPQVISI